MLAVLRPNCITNERSPNASAEIERAKKNAFKKMSAAPSSSTTTTSSAQSAVLMKSTFDTSTAVPCRGHNFDEVTRGGNVDYDRLFESFATTGFQATSFAQAVNIIREMVCE